MNQIPSLDGQWTGIVFQTTTTNKPDPNGSDDDPDGPSWGLIIPIIMIAVFLLCVGLCLWYHKWKGKKLRKRRHDGNVTGFSFQRRRSVGVHSDKAYDTVRDSTRSTTPLNCSVNENITYPSRNVIKVNNVNVIPLHRSLTPYQRPTQKKYFYYCDNNMWKANHSSMTPCVEPLRSRLSPINEIDTPSTVKLSDLSKNYDITPHPPYSPYHLAWATSSNPQSCDKSQSGTASVEKAHELPGGQNQSISRKQNTTAPEKSPFCPNHNTPTTDCDLDSDLSQRPRCHLETSVLRPRPGNALSGTFSKPQDARLTLSTGTSENETSLTTSYPESSFATSSMTSPSSNGYHNPSFSPTEHIPYASCTSSRELSSLASSIAMFSKQTASMMDPNNNSLAAPMPHPSFPVARALNYTLASSIESSDTHFSDNTSMAPNIGSSISGYPTTLTSRSLPDSAGQSHPVSPENTNDLSKIVDELSSIRPADESSGAQPNICESTSHASGPSICMDRPRSWNNVVDGEHISLSSAATSSQTNSNADGPMYFWDNYPLNCKHGVSRSYPDLAQMLDIRSTHIAIGRGLVRDPNRNLQAPVLMKKQYWV